ncbi:MAG: hypothetical protein WD005_01795, partial [Haliea sp.]
MVVRHLNYLRPITIAALAFGMILSHTAASAFDLSGKKIQLIVPYREGGGSDVYARMFAPYLGKHLPGKPSILVRNMPGGASIKGNNWFERNAKPDGSALVTISSSTQVSYLLGGKKVKFDMLQWRPLLASPMGTVFYIHANTGFSAKDPAGSIRKLGNKELRYGAKTVVASELVAFLTYDMLGMNVKPVFGLSRGQTRQAMLRNEAELNTDSAWTYIKKVKKLVEKGTVVPMMTAGFPKKGKVLRDAILPDMPTAVEIATKLHGKKPSGPMYEAWLNFVNTRTTGFALPKGTPDNVYKAYTAAFKATLADPKFN